MECGFVVLINISSAFVIGPILGGALYGTYDVQKTCLYMAIAGLTSACMFMALGFLINDETKVIKLEKKQKSRRRGNGDMKYLPQTPAMTDNECNPCCWPEV